jgi:hypothetical protein
LDSILETQPQLKSCICHCVHCGIGFLAHPRNAGRNDLRCPFGCREHHRRRCCTQRSVAYYRTEAGRSKKKRLNGRRSGQTSKTPLSKANSLPQPPPEEASNKLELRVGGVVLRESDVRRSAMLPYVRMAAGLIEGVRFSLAEIAELLCRSLRQHSIVRRTRTDYVLHFLHQHPP